MCTYHVSHNIYLTIYGFLVTLNEYNGYGLQNNYSTLLQTKTKRHILIRNFKIIINTI